METLDRTDPAKFIAASDLLHVRVEGRPRHFFWEMLARSMGRADLAVDRGLVFDTQQLAIQYAMLGDGLALADPLLFNEEIKAGRLMRPFDLWLDEGYGYYLTTQPEDLSNEAVALFRSWLIARFSAASAVQPPEPENAGAEALKCARRDEARPRLGPAPPPRLPREATKPPRGGTNA